MLPGPWDGGLLWVVWRLFTGLPGVPPSLSGGLSPPSAPGTGEKPSAEVPKTRWMAQWNRYTPDDEAADWPRFPHDGWASHQMNGVPDH